MSSYLVSPLLTTRVVQIGYSVAQAGTLAGALFVVALVLRPFTGALADRLNKKRLLILATLVSSASVVGLALFESYSLLMLSRIVQGIAFAGAFTFSTVLASENIPLSRLGEGLSITALASIFSQAFGPSLGSWLADSFGIPITFIIAACVAASAAMLLIPLKYRFVPNIAPRAKFHLRDCFALELMPFVLFVGAFSYSYGLASSFIPLYTAYYGIPKGGLK